MMTNRQVTEQDFRMPEYRDANVDDYEFRADGKLVRKDRWEKAVTSIRFLVGIDGREFEVPDVVEAVRKLATANEGWVSTEQDPDDPSDYGPENDALVEVRLKDGSVLRNVRYAREKRSWAWAGTGYLTHVVAWRRQVDACVPA